MDACHVHAPRRAQRSSRGARSNPAEQCSRSPTPREPRLRDDLSSIATEGACHSTMVGLGEQYLPPFALAMGMGELAAGLITTIPLMMGGFLQLATPIGVRWAGSNRRWVVFGASLQAISFVPLIVGALTGTTPTALAFCSAAIYWGAGLATIPAWNTWMSTVVPHRCRAKYFAARTRITQAALLAAFVAGGFALQAAKSTRYLPVVFAILFAIASLARAISAWFLARQSEPMPLPAGQRLLGPRELFTRIRQTSIGRLLLFLTMMQGGVQIAGPFFGPFMLRQLQFSYGSYVTLIAVALIAKSLAGPVIGRSVNRWGTRRLLWWGALGIVPLSALWLISNNFWYLMVVQAVGGVAWSAYELAMLLLFLEALNATERTSILTSFQCMQSLSSACGSLLGGALLRVLGPSPGSYFLLFALSSLCRAAAFCVIATLPSVDANHQQASTTTTASNSSVEQLVERPTSIKRQRPRQAAA